MDSIFGIGTPELILILILAGIVMGPNRIALAARWLGKTTAQLQHISRNFMRQINTELAAADQNGDLRQAMNDVQDLRRQLQDMRSEITAAATQPIKEGKAAARESQEMLKTAVQPPENNNTIAPPQFSQPADLPKPVDIPDDPET